MNYRKSNIQIAISSLNEAREDHYDGVNAIYRLAAYVPIPEDTSSDGKERQLNRLIEDLSNQKVRANRIYVSESRIDVDYYPRGFQMARTRGQFVGLQLEFAQFLNQSSIWGMEIQRGSYWDDPDDSVRSASNDQINFFPEFNSKCFGLQGDEEIDIYFT